MNEEHQRIPLQNIIMKSKVAFLVAKIIIK